MNMDRSIHFQLARICSGWIPLIRQMVVLIVVGLMVSIGANLVAQEKTSKENPTVGAPGDIYQIVLPGTELTAKPLVEGSPIVIRITDVFPHGDAFRYDIRFHGLEPGTFNLAKWLERKDGSATEDLPEIPVEIQSLLPAGQIQPNALESGWLPRLGGYRVVAIAAVALWLIGLLALIFGGRKSKSEEAAVEKPKSLAELLETRIQDAMDQKMETSQYAELERMLFAFWRKRMKLEGVSTSEAMTAIKQDKNSGPLMIQLEQWMHNPSASRDIDLAELVAPYRDMPVDTPEFQS